MTRRRFLLREPPSGGRASLDPEVARHAVKVLRLAAGDAVVLFDGRGVEWEGAILPTRSRPGTAVSSGRGGRRGGR